MSYTVIKTVKGRQYLYRQESYRVGKKVKTRSVCLGSMDSQGTLTEPSKANPVPLPIKVEEVTEDSSTPSKGSPTSQRKSKKAITTKLESLVTSKIKLADFSISQPALESKILMLHNKLRKKGLNPLQLPKVVFRHGKEVGHKISRGKCVITLPKYKKGQGGAFRKEVSKTVAQAALVQWEQDQPAEFERLSLHFNRSYERTRQSVQTYAMNGRDRNRLFKCQAMRFWGEVKQFSKSAKSAERLGMVDFGKKSCWQDEAASIYATMQQKGQSEFMEEVGKEYGLAQNEYKQALAESKRYSVFNPRRQAAKKRRKRAAARLRSQIEMLKKRNSERFFLIKVDGFFFALIG